MALGDERLSGESDENGWARLGTNLDGVDTVSAKMSPCYKANQGGGYIDFADGPCGVDNALLRAKDVLSTARQQEAFDLVVRSWALSLDSVLPPSGGVASARLLAATATSGVWAAHPYKVGADAQQNQLVLRRRERWMVSDMFDAYLELTYTTTSTPFPLHLRRSRIFAKVSEDGGSITSGVLLGISSSAEALNSVCDSLGHLELPSSADIALDGSPGAFPCDGVSVAIGFRAESMNLNEGPPVEKSKVCQ